MRPLSHNIQQNILSLLGKGFTTRQIVEQCNVGQFKVQRLRKIHLPNIKLSRGGRPKKLSPQDKRACVRAVTSGRRCRCRATARRNRH
jgi:hypothetical protein